MNNQNREMSLDAAIAMVDGGGSPRVRLALWARRTGRGTLIYGHTAGFHLPEGVGDAEVTISAEDVRFHVDRTREFEGQSYMSVMESGSRLIAEYEEKTRAQEGAA